MANMNYYKQSQILQQNLTSKTQNVNSMFGGNLSKQKSKTNMLSATLSEGSFNNVTLKPGEKFMQPQSAKNIDKKAVQLTAQAVRNSNNKKQSLGATSFASGDSRVVNTRPKNPTTDNVSVSSKGSFDSYGFSPSNV